ncbi:MAG: P-loop NTPase, partial [Bacteroidales bacterium]|nr:P-loop NTPase [Bacteroidales bacterium]
GVEQLAKAKDLPFLGAVPIVMSIREGGDNGEPAALHDNTIIGKQFAEIAKKVML